MHEMILKLTIDRVGEIIYKPKGEFHNYKDLYIDDFRIGFHSGKLAFRLTLHNRGANLITKTLEISCENVSFS